MPYTLHWQGDTVYVQWRGAVDDNEVAQLAGRIAGDERFDDLLWVMHDFRECERVVFHVANVEAIAATDAVAIWTNPDIIVAAVTTRDDVRAAFKAYVDAGVDTARVQVFDTVDEAQAWLLRATAKNKGE